MFPARAGMSRHASKNFSSCSDVPRASGDEPNREVILKFLERCSPRERG